MNNPGIFRQARAFLRSGNVVPDVGLEEKWEHILRHCRMAVDENGAEEFTMASLRGRLMAYSKGMHNGRQLRSELQHGAKIAQLEEIRGRHLRQKQDWPELTAESGRHR